jgi:hypothetical protein
MVSSPLVSTGKRLGFLCTDISSLAYIRYMGRAWLSFFHDLRLLLYCVIDLLAWRYNVCLSIIDA